MGFGSGVARVLGLTPAPGVDDILRAADGMQVVPVLTGDLEQAKSLPPSVQAAFGLNFISDKVSREDALGIPAVSRGRDVICSTIAGLPIRVIGKSGAVVERSLFRQFNPDIPNVVLIAQTLEDMLFETIAWWRVLNRDSDGFPSSVTRLDPAAVAHRQGSEDVMVNGERVPARDLIRFECTVPGLLTGKKARSLRTAILLEDAVRKYARLDIPLGAIVDEEGGLEEAEVDEMIADWEEARASHTTAYLPKGMDYKTFVLGARDIQLGEARAYQAADVARMMNLPASIVNAPSNDSLTYATTESNRRELVDITLSAFMNSFCSRLSMPDVTPRGLVVQFNLIRFLLGDTKTVMETAAIAIDKGIMDVDEIRVEWLGMSPKGVQS